MPAERRQRSEPVRSLVVRCPDWPVLAMGASPSVPAAVLFANRVVACTPAARAAGVVVGNRRREAQGRCPELEVFERDESREARAFEPVIQAVETFTPRLELTRPGTCTFATRGPARYFGGDRSLAEQVLVAVDRALAPASWDGRTRVGVADGPFAAALAARRWPNHVVLADLGVEHRDDPPPDVSVVDRIRVVAPGESAAFLAPLPVSVLADEGEPGPRSSSDTAAAADLADVLTRLGLTTLGAFAALAGPEVLARFGTEGARAHRRAAGLDDRPPDAREPPPDLARSAELDPPAERVDTAAFVAKALADEVFEALEARGLSCTRVLIAAETEHGESIERLWRHEGTLSAGALSDRVRWQLDGWLHAPAGTGPTSGITLLRIAPDEVVPALGRQLGFWGGESDTDIRAVRALARVQGLLGPDAVLVPEWQGGRGPAEQLALVPAAAVDLTEDRPAARRSWIGAPWPGRLPPPAPAVVHPEPEPVEVLDADGRPVVVSGRGVLSAAPASLAAGDRCSATEVTAWAGPWPAEERWWDAASHRRRARLQVVTSSGTAHVLTLESGTWHLEATY
jgi:protein ImuB